MEHLPIRNPSAALEVKGSVISLEPFQTANDVHRARAMRVALVGNFAPRKCGIATFTTDVFQQLGAFHPEVRLDVYALQDSADPVAHAQAHAEIERGDEAAYIAAARRMNDDGVDAVWIQHEFGIFGGDCGEQVLTLIDRVAAPLIVTMHTVLSAPSEKQEMVTRRLVGRASRIMVMCRSGRDVLVERFGADAARIDVIEHGAPDRPLRLAEHDQARRTLMTFGLLGPGKGLETAIEALPAIVARHPEVIYRIAGVSHPNELRRNGEAYREGLKALAERLGVSAHIEWIDRFLDTEALIEQLQDCDIYLTPYPGLQQSTSGTLSYAVALGRAVVSTPYIHARELLGDVGGELVPPGDAPAIAEAVNRLLDHPEELDALQLRTHRRGRRTIWRHFAANTRNLLESAIAPESVASVEPARLVVPSLTTFDLMCDSTSMLQHSRGVVPDRRHGYCLDDNVRALMLVNRVRWPNPGEELRRGTVFASFLQHAWNEERKLFRNFMNFDRTWCEDVGSEDSNGRAIWALGDCAERSRLPRMRQWARMGFDDFAGIALHFDHPRSLAFAALGACAMLRADGGNAMAHRIVERCGDLLDKLLGGSRRPDWTWFEAMVGYDNPRMSQALIECGERTGNAEWIAAGLDSLAWVLERQTAASGHFRAIGSETFGKPGDILPFDQQPLEAWAAIDACTTAWRVDPQDRWLDHAHRAYRWFLGENDRAVVLGDLQFGSCLDGVTPHGANQNSGAESVLAFQLAYYGYEELVGFAGPDWRENAAKGSRE